MAPKFSKHGAKRQSQPKSKKVDEYRGEDEDELRAQLGSLGLYLRNVPDDGNCLPRALADQLLGDHNRYQEMRDLMFETISSNRGDYEQFHADDDESFDEWLSKVLDDGEWAGDQELMAILRHFNVNGIIHQAGQKPKEKEVAPRKAPVIQVAFDGQHYYSVRDQSDRAPGQPAKHVTLQEMDARAAKIEDDTKAKKNEEAKHVHDLPPVQEACGTASFVALAPAGRASADAVSEARDEQATTLGESGSACVLSRAQRKRLRDLERKQQKAAGGLSESDERMASLVKELISV
jgi:hypothetical protein